MILGTDTFSISAVVGASLGGMYALEWAASYPAVVQKVISIACGLR
jgi:homoserine acetyltransferase